MANVQSANTYYVNATGSLNQANVKVRSVVASAIGGAAELQLQDLGTSAVKLDLTIPSGGAPVILRFQDYPMVFTGGVGVSVATNVKATLVYDYTQG